MNNDNKFEIELRGKVIAMSLRVEDALTKLIYSFFYPNSSDKETAMIYLEELISPLTFNTKKEILKKIYKSPRYKNVLEKYLIENEMVGLNKSFKDYNDYTKYSLNLIAEVITERNILAHGNDITGGFISLNKDEMIIANKSKFYKFSEDFMTEYSDKTLKAFLMLTMVKIER